MQACNNKPSRTVHVENMRGQRGEMVPLLQLRFNAALSKARYMEYCSIGQSVSLYKLRALLINAK
jgi:hypothetical protein